jgi:hypothetical protein
MRQGLITGHNVDHVDIDIGLQTLAECGYDDPHTVMVITYALQWWARGEEEQSQRIAIDPTFYGIDLTSWLRVISAAIENKN